MHPSAKMDLKVKASERSQTHYDLELPGIIPLTFDPKELFCICVVSPLSHKGRGGAEIS